MESCPFRVYRGQLALRPPDIRGPNVLIDILLINSQKDCNLYQAREAKPEMIRREGALFCTIHLFGAA